MRKTEWKEYGDLMAEKMARMQLLEATGDAEDAAKPKKAGRTGFDESVRLEVGGKKAGDPKARGAKGPRKPAEAAEKPKPKARTPPAGHEEDAVPAMP